MRVIRKLGEGAHRIQPGSPIARFALQANEMAFVELMRAEPASAATLIKQFGDPKIARRTLYLLAITDCLEPYAPASQQKLRAVRAASPPRPRMSTPPAPHDSMRAPRGTPPQDRHSTPPNERESALPGADAVLPAALSNLPPSRTLSGEIVAPRSLPPPPPPSLSPELTKRWEEISRVIAMMDRQSCAVCRIDVCS